jgi:hypothetical protein
MASGPGKMVSDSSRACLYSAGCGRYRARCTEGLWQHELAASPGDGLNAHCQLRHQGDVMSLHRAAWRGVQFDDPVEIVHLTMMLLHGGWLPTIAPVGIVVVAWPPTAEMHPGRCCDRSQAICSGVPVWGPASR